MSVSLKMYVLSVFVIVNYFTGFAGGYASRLFDSDFQQERDPPTFRQCGIAVAYEGFSNFEFVCCYCSVSSLSLNRLDPKVFLIN